jgi:DNA-binding beta-propeller fold protein YncE
MTISRVFLAAAAACLVTSAASEVALARVQHQHAASIPYSIVDRIPAADGGWDFANIDPVSAKLYIARSDAITSVDLNTRQVVNHLADAHRGHEVLVLENGKTIFVTDGETGLGRFIAASGGTVLAEVATGKKPDAAFLDPKTGLIAVMNAGDGTISLVDPAKRTLVGSISVGGTLEFGVPDGKGVAYVNVEDTNSIAVIDLVSRKQTATIALTGCDAPTGLALVAKGTRLISACDNETAVVVDTATRKIVGNFAIGKGPDAVLVDEARGRAFIPCGGSGTLIEVAIDNPTRIRPLATIVTQLGAKTGAIDLRDGRIYLPTATLAAPELGAKRGKPVPGSFIILVVGKAG